MTAPSFPARDLRNVTKTTIAQFYACRDSFAFPANHPSLKGRSRGQTEPCCKR